MRNKTVFFLLLFILASILSAVDYYVRPAGGNYGLENGINYANAWDGLVNVKWGAGGVQPGDTLWVCGLHVYNMTNTGNMASRADIDVISGTSESSRVIIRGDYPGDPGIVWGAYKISYGTWNYEGNNVWSTTIVGYPYPDLFFEDITADSWVVMDKETTLEGCQKNPGSFYAADFSNGSTLYVHCSDDGNPTGRIYQNRYGYNFVVRGGKSYITFMNLKLYAIANWVGSPDDAHHITWIGCTLAYGEHSVLRFYDNCHYMQVINCDLSWAGNGIYNISSTNNAPSYYKYSGNIIHDIGVRASTQNSDAHGIGIQGGHDGLIEDNYIYNCGSGVTLYTFTNQELKNTIVRRNFVRDTHTLGGANSYGIETSCNNDSLSDKSGNIFSQNIVMNAAKGFKLQFEDEQKLYNNVAANCGISFYSGRSYNGYGGKVKARNNISLNPTNYHVVFGTSGADSLCDYDFNLYFPDGSGKFSYNSGTYSFSGWQALARSGYTFDPYSKVADLLFINPGNQNFHLQSSSPAIDAGVDVGITQDRDGTPIPQGFAPDIGAYEHRKIVYTRISASPTSGAPPLAVSFSADAMGDFPPFRYRWHFGDGQSSSSQNCSHTYTQVGTYVSTLTVTDSRGNKESQSINIHAYRTYRLSLATNTGSPPPGAGGTTNPSPGNHSYANGSTIQLSAVPYINYRFSQWTGDIAPSESFEPNTAVIMDRDKMATANFCAKCGDVNGDLTITPADAQTAFDIFLGKISNPTECQKENADVNCDGTKMNPKITPGDAQAIFDKYLGRSELPCACAGITRASILSNNKISASNFIIDEIITSRDHEILVHILINASLPITAFGFDIAYSSDILEFIDIERSYLAKRYSQFDANEISQEIVRVGGYSSMLEKSQLINDIFAILIFKAKKNTAELTCHWR
jgi:PKD repeat protein